MHALMRSRYMKRWLLKNPWTRPMCAFNVAAIKIQSVIRRFLQRCRRSRNNRNPDRKKKKKKSQLNKYLAYMDLCKSGKAHEPSWLKSGFSMWCVVKLQAWIRMLHKHAIHKRKMRVVNQIAAIVIQTAWKNSTIWRLLWVAKRNKFLSSIDPNQEARKIQRGWRSFCNKRVYKYLKELVLVKFKGAPADLLRCIIPGEVDLFDKASGVHVRFRLGGAIFPPKIMFKVFTHRALCDVNAFAPRAYIKEQRMDPFQLHNHLSSVPPNILKNKSIRVGGRYFDSIVTTNTTNGEGWYRRDDNNEWRPIACQVIDNEEIPEWMKESLKDTKPTPFHFSRLKRQQDMIKHRKKRKKEWLMKAYRLAAGDNLLPNETQDPSIPTDVEGVYNSQEFCVREPECASHSVHSMSSRDALNIGNKLKLRILTGRYTNTEVSGDGLEGFVPTMTKVDVAYRSPGKGEYVQSLTCDDGHGVFEAQDTYNGALGSVHRKMQSNNEKKLKSEKEKNVRFLPQISSNKRSVFNAGANKPTDEEVLKNALNASDEDLVKWGMALDYEAYNTNWGGLASSLPSDFDFHSANVGILRDI